MTNSVPDHRCLLGLVPTQHLPPHKTFKEIIKTYQLVVYHTIPYISAIWKIYLNTHPLTNDITLLTQISNLITETMTNTVPDHRCLLGLASNDDQGVVSKCL